MHKLEVTDFDAIHFICLISCAVCNATMQSKVKPFQPKYGALSVL